MVDIKNRTLLGNSHLFEDEWEIWHTEWLSNFISDNTGKFLLRDLAALTDQ